MREEGREGREGRRGGDRRDVDEENVEREREKEIVGRRGAS